MSDENWENALVSRVVDTGDFKSAKYVTLDYLYDQDARNAWSFIAKHVGLYNQTPSRELLASHVPGFEFEETGDNVRAIAERVRDVHLYNALNRMIEEVMQQTETSSVEDVIKYAADEALKLQTLAAEENASAVDLTTRVADETEDYYRRRDLKGVLGIPWPWPRLNRATYGIQNRQLIIFYARPKNMKTFVLLYLAYWCHYRGRRVYIATREMSAKQLQQRYCAIWAEVDLDRYARGQLTKPEERQWLEAMAAFEEAPPIVIDTVPGVGSAAADAIALRAQEHGAEFLGVDGVYFFGNRQWDLMGEFTTRIKYHLLNSLDLPCIATSQGARGLSMGKKAKYSMDDIGYGDSLGQDADLLIKFQYSKEDKRIKMSLPGVRDGTQCEFVINARPGYDFSQAFETPDNEDEDEDTKEGENDDFMG